jgi:hypothetical protein
MIVMNARVHLYPHACSDFAQNVETTSSEDTPRMHIYAYVRTQNLNGSSVSETYRAQGSTNSQSRLPREHAQNEDTDLGHEEIEDCIERIQNIIPLPRLSELVFFFHHLKQHLGKPVEEWITTDDRAE